QILFGPVLSYGISGTGKDPAVDGNGTKATDATTRVNAPWKASAWSANQRYHTRTYSLKYREYWIHGSLNLYAILFCKKAISLRATL
ncbi:hypothetical protein, partial [Paenisporosarcina sp. TG20]|uniref:hypothetical protein n=1 Tax=Paenisporosarcina sp. TG20 TaxID=1211706 RepID=UPI0005933DD3